MLFASFILEHTVTITAGLYSITISMEDDVSRRASGVIGLYDGKLVGGDSYFYYTGTFQAEKEKWRGELSTHQHTPSGSKRLLFGDRVVSCGFSGTYTKSAATVHGTALVGKRSVAFQAQLTLLSPLQEIGV